MNLTLNDVRKLLGLILVRQSKPELIRIGKDYDGGYLVPSDLDRIKFVVSAGISDDVSFDDYFASRKINVLQFDPTIAAPPHSNYSKYFKFEQKAFGIFSGQMGVNFDDVVNLNNLNNEDGNLLAKFDVEGGEYSAILSSSEDSLSKFRCLVGEFHGLDTIDDISNYQTIISTFEKLSRIFFISHIHVNSNSNLKLVHGIPIPSLLEITFLNRRFYEYNDELVFAGLHMLDQTNVMDLPQIPWNPAWYLI